MRKILTLLLTIIYTSNSLAEQGCYSPEERKKIAQAIIDLRLCQVSLMEKDRLIQDKLNSYSGPQWWQDPTTIVAGTVISLSVGGILTYILVKKN